MGESRVRALYKKLGPVLYARAHRVLKNRQLAEDLTRQAVTEVAAAGVELSDAELLRKARSRLAELCKEGVRCSTR
jgi:hypothetical protein